MKKTMAVLIALFLLFSLAGCGVREKINEEITENIISNIVGEDVDVNLDDGFGGTEWPTGGVVDQIPQFTKGKISTVINSADSCWIEIKDVNEADFLQYVEALKQAGFKDGTEYSDQEGSMYSAYKDNKILATATYSKNKTVVIQVLTSAE